LPFARDSFFDYKRDAMELSRLLTAQESVKAFDRDLADPEIRKSRRRSGVGGQRSEIRSQRSEVRDQKSEISRFSVGSVTP
jgi:hypothetical protein